MTSTTPPPPQRPLRPVRSPRRSFASLRAIVALILREMSTTYGRSPGGYLWAILEPAAGIALLSLVFSAAFHSPPMGISFPTFYATGMMPFMMFNSVHGKLATALLYSKPLLAYPTVTFLDAMLARFILNTMTYLLVSYLVLGGCLMVFETRTTRDLVTIIEAFTLVSVLALGVGVLNCYLFTRVPIWHRAWGILMRPMFIISGIFFLFESIPEAYGQFLWFNPLVHVIGLMRRGFYGSYDAPYVSELYVLLVSLTCLTLGLVLLRRHHRDLLTNN